MLIIFTRVQQDVKAKTRREQKNKKSDDDLAADYMKVVEKQFPNSKGLQYLYLDACYDKNDDDENTAFLNALGTLRQLLDNNTGLTTASIRRVETQNETLRRQIKEHEKARKEKENEFKEAVENIGRRAQEDIEKLKAEMQRRTEEHNAKTDEERRKTEKMHQQQIQDLKKAEEEKLEEGRRELEALKKAHEDKGLPTARILESLGKVVQMSLPAVATIIEAVTNLKMLKKM